jgi:hypothetical protein
MRDAFNDRLAPMMVEAGKTYIQISNLRVSTLFLGPAAAEIR